jgi:exonuclease III
MNSLNKVTVIHQNIRSLRSNFDSFMLHFSTFNCKPNIIVLTEIWIDDSEINLYRINGYKHFVKCNNNSRAKGVFVYVKENIHCCSMPVNVMSADCVLLSVKLGFTEFELLSVYRNLNFSTTQFYDEIEVILKGSKNNLIVVGDININVLVSNNDSDAYINSRYITV